MGQLMENSEVVNGTPAGKQVIKHEGKNGKLTLQLSAKTALRLLSRSRDRCEFYPSRTGKSTPRTRAKNHNGGAGVPTGRIRRSSRAANFGSRTSQRVYRRSSKRKVKAVTAP